MLAELRYQGMTSLVVGHDCLFFGVDDTRFALEACHHAVNGFLKVDYLDHILPLACRAERGLVDEVGEVGTDEPRRAGRNLLQRHAWGEGHLPRMHPEDLRPALQIGPVNHHLAVEAAGA